MIVLGILCGALAVSTAIMYSNLCYKNHCIEDLEQTNKHLREQIDSALADALLEVKEYTEPRKAYRMMDIRDYCNKGLEELAQKNRTSQDHESND